MGHGQTVFVGFLEVFLAISPSRSFLRVFGHHSMFLKVNLTSIKILLGLTP